MSLDEEFRDCDLETLLGLGQILDGRPAKLDGETVCMFLSRSLLKVRSRSGAILPLVPNQAQREFERRRGQKNVVLKARQMGISTWAAGRFFLKTITQPGTLSVQVAQTHAAAEAIFRMVHRFLELMPEDLRRGALRTSRVTKRQIAFAALDSEFRVESAEDPNAGRGLTITNLHCSEVARWQSDAEEVLLGLKAAMPPTGELILESTPNGAEGCFWKEWTEAEARGTVQHFFPWWWESAYKGRAVAAATLTAAERSLMEANGLSLEQIGFRRSLGQDTRLKAKQEYAEDPESCFLSSGSCVFDVRAIDERLASTRQAVERRMNGGLLVWYLAQAQRRYVVAVDPAGGGDEGDYSAAQAIDLETGLQCAELRAHLPVLELARVVTALAREYNGAWLVVERNNHGSGVLAHLRSTCKAERIYSEGGQDGWLTSSTTRPEMIAGLGAILVERPELFQSERLLRECRSFVRLRNGKMGARSGAHDDCLMAMSIALAARPELLLAR